MIIDCQSCPVRDLHCGDCMVTALLEPPTADLPLDAAERAAVTRFAASGLVAAEAAVGHVRVVSPGPPSARRRLSEAGARSSRSARSGTRSGTPGRSGARVAGTRR